MKTLSAKQLAFQKRQAARAKARMKRDADIRARVKAGDSIRDLAELYQITPERIRQIGKGC
jgi:Mor family transcriptional regulator